MQLFFFPTLALSSDLLTGTLGLVVTVVISFVLITVVSSYYRFQNIVKLAEDTQPEEMGVTPIDILRVQIVRYLAGCARRNTSFSIALIQTTDPEVDIRMDSPVINAIKTAARRDDIVCVYDDHASAVLMEVDPEDSEGIFTRIITAVKTQIPSLGQNPFHVGIASYPAHGLNGKSLLKVALEGLEQSTDENPVVLPEIIDIDADEEDVVEEEHLEGEEHEVEDHVERRKGRKKGMLDELTGVLKPTAVSAYMQRMMSDFRYKKKKAALFCVGVNNMDHIERFHGADVADDVLAGVSKILQENFRAEDLIGRHEKYAFLILMQATIEEAEIIGKRVSTLIQQTELHSDHKKIKVTITLGVATFPEHGHNLHQLYNAGQKVLNYSRTNDIRAYAVYDPAVHAKVVSKPMRSIKSIKA